MRTVLVAFTLVGVIVAASPCSAGVAPSHDQSQLSQSGAKIAPPEKKAEQPQKDEKDKEQQEKDQKR
jgi:hypothetical protein